MKWYRIFAVGLAVFFNSSTFAVQTELNCARIDNNSDPAQIRECQQKEGSTTCAFEKARQLALGSTLPEKNIAVRDSAQAK